MGRFTLVIATVVLIIAAVAAVIAEASEKQADSRVDEMFRHSRENVARVDQQIGQKNKVRAESAYAQEVRQLQEQERIERRNLEAAAQFGQWGPHLADAAEKYGQDPAALYAVMSCESKGDPNADNGVNKGLFQFEPSTFAGTPYGGASIFDGQAQIYAAAWMWSQGRKGEWGCA